MQFQSSFLHQGSPARIVFGPGSLLRLADEADRLGARKVLILTTPEQREAGDRVAALLGDRSVGIFSGATMHTPVSVTDAAMAALDQVDCLVGIGGGSTIGLSKALALRTGLPQIAIPTTFAGSEATPILGQTDGGVKSTLTDTKVLPRVILYDAELVATMPVRMVATSALNAIAHAAEGLYAQDRSPVSSLMALEGISALATSVPRIQADRSNTEAWAMAQYGAWLCGTVLGQVGMSLHHKLCHTLGGSFDLPHAETHAVILPHAIAYNEAAVPDLLSPVAAIFDAPTAAAGLFAFAQRVGTPTALTSLGFGEVDIAKAVGIALSRPYWNPRPLTEEGLSALLSRAVRGDAPAI